MIKVYETRLALKNRIIAFTNDDDFRLLNIEIAKAFSLVAVHDVEGEDKHVRVEVGQRVFFFDDCEAKNVFDDEERIKIVHRLIPNYFSSLDAACEVITAELGSHSTCWSLHEDPVGCSARLTWWPEGISGSRQIITESMQQTKALSLILCVVEVLLKEMWYMKMGNDVLKYEERYMTSPGVSIYA